MERRLLTRHTLSSVERKLTHHTPSPAERRLSSVERRLLPHHTPSTVKRRLTHHTLSSVERRLLPHHTPSTVKRRLTHHTPSSAERRLLTHHTLSSVERRLTHHTPSPVERLPTHHTLSPVERTLKTALRKHAARFGCQWEQYLPGILWAYRNTPHSSAGEKPSFLLYGIDCRSPTEAAYLPSADMSPTDIDDYCEELMLSLTTTAIRKERLPEGSMQRAWGLGAVRVGKLLPGRL